jgi:tRNA pseudouridine38-40 synthase
MRHLKLTLAYDGKNYVGWQRQKNGLAIQQVMEETWHAITGERILIVSSGRTDSGVHARGQVCSLTTESAIPCGKLVQAINAMSPPGISAIRCEEVGPGFHAITSAIEKTYVYYIQSGRIQDPFRQEQAWFVPHVLSIEDMRQAAIHLIGRHDFKCFQASGSNPRTTTTRTISRLEIVHTFRDPFDDIEIWVTADGFLYNMVRNIVGTLVQVARKSETPDWVKTVLESKDRTHAGQTAPPHGLFLDNVVYSDSSTETTCRTRTSGI